MRLAVARITVCCEFCFVFGHFALSFLSLFSLLLFFFALL